MGVVSQNGEREIPVQGDKARVAVRSYVLP